MGGMDRGKILTLFSELSYLQFSLAFLLAGYTVNSQIENYLI